MRTSATRFAILAAMLVPATALAQAALSGTVRDASGAILPGVSVEASSTALIEQTRVAVADGTGQYRIIELPPGTYALTASLSGFTTVRRENIDVAGTQTFIIPIEMHVGRLEETVVVIAETPVVDAQGVRRGFVLDADVIQAIPATRAVGSLLNATPGLTVDNNGLAVSPTMTFFSAHGGEANEGRMTINGMLVAGSLNGGGVSSFIYDTVNADEISITVSGGLGEAEIGGPVMNLLPRAGGDTFRGQAFFNTAGGWSKGRNLTDALRSAGITETPGVINAYDASVSYSGPIRRDRLWFLGSYRKLDSATAVEGVVANANAGNPARWDWVADPDVGARLVDGRTMYIGRLTAQVGRGHRVSLNHEHQRRCAGTTLFVESDGCRRRGRGWVGLGSLTESPEARVQGYFDSPMDVTQATWTAPVTNRVLLEAGFTRFTYTTFGRPPPDGILDLIRVVEQSTTVNPATGQPYAPRAGYAYRGVAFYIRAPGNPNTWRASMSYVTGSHNLKVGYQGAYSTAQNRGRTSKSQLAYRFNQGQPNQVSFMLPDWQSANRTTTASVYVQDSWTRGRLTLQGALRYDRAWSFSPAEGNGTMTTSRFNSAPIAFERTAGVDAFNDVTPRIGVAYDLFGNGRTALKFNWGHYLDAATTDGVYTSNNPANRIVTSVARAWTDTNNDKVVDCNLLDPARQTAIDTCAELTGDSLNFGRVGSDLTQVNPELLRGWGVRANDYQWGLNVQQEILARVSVDVGYNRRWWKGFSVTDDVERDPSEYTSWTISAPDDPRLSGGGGYPITLWVPTATAAAVAPRNHVTFETDFGPSRISYWHGIDVTLNARPRNGLTIQIGTSSGRKVEDTCATMTKINSPDARGCRNVEDVQTTIRGLSAYTVPIADVLVSATVRSQPPLQLAANWNVPNTMVQSLLGRLPPGSMLAGNTMVSLTDPEHRVYADERRTQVDVRLSKILRFGRTRTDIGVDVGNLLNTNYATAFEGTYQYSADNVLNGGTWGNPTAVYAPRFVRFNLTAMF